MFGKILSFTLGFITPAAGLVLFTAIVLRDEDIREKLRLIVSEWA